MIFRQQDFIAVPDQTIGRRVKSDPRLRCRRSFPFALLFLACLVMFLPGGAVGADWKTLPGHRPKVIGQLTASGRLAATNQLRLALGVSLRDPAGLAAFLAQVSDPASPNYRLYLTPSELTARFGPSPSDYEAVKAYARSNGLAVVTTFDNRLVLDVAGPVAAVERALHLTLRTYPHPTEARQFFAPDTEPTVAAGLPVTDIQGLSDYSKPHPQLRRKNPAIVQAKSGSAPDGSYIGDDFRRAYVPGTTLTGTGQMVGLLEFDGFYANDIAAYAATAGSGRPNIPIQTVLMDDYDGTPTTNGNDEVSIDIEMTMSMAPGLARIVVFEAGPGGLQNDLLNFMLASNSIKQLSCSWGWSDGPSGTTDAIFQYMAAAGQSFFNASGDSDAFTAGANSTNGVDNPLLGNAPSSSPYITQVGGTTLTMSGLGTAYTSEKVWNWGLTEGSYDGSSGGVSSYYPIPSWQTNLSNLASRGGSTSFRNIPDVALTADDVYVVSGGAGGGAGGYGGTSCSAPLWAGFMALVNQQAVAQGQPVAGFINPAIYALAAGPNYASYFHDVTAGNNTWPSSPNLFSAQSGYDLCTGLGTPKGTALINALSPSGGALNVFAASGDTFYGPVGGTFYPGTGTLQLANTAGLSLGWSLVNTSAWLVVSATKGSLAARSSTNVVMSVSSAANRLAAAVYNTSLVITNPLGQILVVPLTLSVGQPVVLNGGFETGDFSDWILSGNMDGSLVASDSGYVHSGSFTAELGPAGSLGYLIQNVLTIPGQTYLLSFWLRNPTGDTPNQFQAQWNGTTIFSQSNLADSAWTNPRVLVTATGAVTPLQFGFENDQDYFALDDVSATPAALSFHSLVRSANHYQLVWNTTAGLHYQVQYQTNLLQTNWINLGSVTAATTNTLTLVDTDAISGQRFYRLSVAP